MAFDVDTASVTVILRELAIPLSVTSKRDRIAMQKAIYLAQRKGVDLGFRYSWYLNGPYSTKLADVYYRADEERQQYAGLEADDHFKAKLSPTKKLIKEKPDAANLTDWLEALVSIDFLVTVNGRSINSAKDRVRDLKPHVADLLDGAESALAAEGFIQHASA